MPALTSQRSARKPGRNLPAEHSGRIVYADPRSLPSYPTVGVKLDSTNSAALQASQTKSPPAIYTPGPVNSASLKAATAAAAASAALASPRPAQASQAPATESSEAPVSPRSAQRRQHQRKASESSNLSAAPSAAPSVSNMSTRGPANTTNWGNSAATQAFRNSQSSAAASAAAPPPKPIPEIAALGPQPSLRAAVGAMKSASGSGPTLRPRHKSSSTSSLRHQKSLSSHYPEGVSANQASSSAANALKAATAATKARGGDRNSLYREGGSVPYTTMGRQMYTSHPHIGPEHDNEAHDKMLHASAVAMAKKMYNLQAGSQAGSEAGAAASSGTQGTNLQEAAYKLAQERLEALHEKYGKDREFRDYYVDPNAGAASTPSRRFSMRDRLRRRRSSESDVSEGRSIEIRNQMRQVSGKISASEEKKRQDRQNVLLAAQRNVKSQLHDIDEQVYANSGRVAPTMMTSWEKKAHTVAQDRANAQLSKYPRADQYDIGGGKFIPRNQVDKIAARNVQPVIDDMHEKAQAEFERQEAARKEQEDRKAEAIVLKSRDKELKDLKKKLKQEEKEKKNAAKAEEKARKAEEKASKKRGSFMAGFTKDKETETKETSKPVAAVIPEAPTHQTSRDEDELEETDSEVMTAPGTTSSIRETREVDTPTPTTEPEHPALATESTLSKTRDPVSPVSPGEPLTPVSPETRTGWAAPAVVVTAAAAIPAVIVSKSSVSSPSAEDPTAMKGAVPESVSKSIAEPTSVTTPAPAKPAVATSGLDPEAPSFVVPASIALPPTPAALPEAPSTPFTEPRAAPAVPSTPRTATTSTIAAAAPASALYSAFPSPPSPASPPTPSAASASAPTRAPEPVSVVSTPDATTAAYNPSPPANVTANEVMEPRGRTLTTMIAKPQPSDDAPVKPIEYDEVEHEQRKKSGMGSTAGTFGAVGAFGVAGALGADLASRSKSIVKPTSNGSDSSPPKLTTAPSAPAATTSPAAPAAPAAPTTTAVPSAGAAAVSKPQPKPTPVAAKSADEPSSPKNKSKVKTWFKSKFSKSGKAGATDAVGIPTTIKEKPRDTTYSAASTDINARKTFVGGHALTSTENVSTTGPGAQDSKDKDASPAMGSGGLSLPVLGGLGGGFAAGTTAAVAAASDKYDTSKTKANEFGNSSASKTGDTGNSFASKTLDTGNSFAAKTADTGNSFATKTVDTGNSFVSKTTNFGSSSASKADDTAKSAAPKPTGLPDTGVPMEKKDGLNPGLLDITGKSRTGAQKVHDADDKCKEVPLGTAVEQASNPSTANNSPTAARFPKEVSGEDDTTTSADSSPKKTVNNSGLLDPFVTYANKGTGSNAESSNATDSGSYLSSGISGVKSAATGVATAATGAVAGGLGYASTLGGNKDTSNDTGNRASYASSNYTNDGAAAPSGAHGVPGSEFGLGTNIFTSITKTGQLTDAQAANSSTYVTVSPPSAVSPSEPAIDAYPPPQTLRDPASRKAASPVRDSRFLENLEDQF